MKKIFAVAIAALMLGGFSAATVTPASAASLSFHVGSKHHSKHWHQHLVCKTHWRHHHKSTVCFWVPNHY